MSIIRNLYRLMSGDHKALVMDVQEVRDRIARLTVARHRHASFAAGGDSEKYRHACDDWMRTELGEELTALRWWLENAK